MASPIQQFSPMVSSPLPPRSALLNGDSSVSSGACRRVPSLSTVDGATRSSYHR